LELEKRGLLAIPLAAGDNNGAFDKKQKHHCIIIEAAAGTLGWRGHQAERKQVTELIHFTINDC
jgi:hypothetical protein